MSSIDYVCKLKAAAEKVGGEARWKGRASFESVMHVTCGGSRRAFGQPGISKLESSSHEVLLPLDENAGSMERLHE